MKDDWLTAAFSDDALVVELLFRLKQSSSDPPKPRPLSLPLSWGHRQPRSKPPPFISAKKDSSAARCSPTTPLSWSAGAASPSDDDYISNSSRLSSDPSRSKGAFANDPAYATSNCKRSRKKKTFAELKEEENLLLKERVDLTRKLASLHVTLEEQRARSENFKRIKVDLNLQSRSEVGGASGNSTLLVSSHSNQMETSTSGRPHSGLPRHATYEGFGSCGVDKEVETQQRCFVLPDLNMMPVEEEIGSQFLSGIS